MEDIASGSEYFPKHAKAEEPQDEGEDEAIEDEPPMQRKVSIGVAQLYKSSSCPTEIKCTWQGKASRGRYSRFVRLHAHVFCRRQS